jgi:hypothetical protein
VGGRVAANFTETAIPKAVKRWWDASPLPGFLPNGIFRGKASPKTRMPYCIFDIISSVPAGYSNVSLRRDVGLQYKDYHTNIDDAEEMMSRVANVFDDAVLDLGAGEGSVVACDRGPVSSLMEGDNVWASMVDFKVRRQVGRQRASFA